MNRYFKEKTPKIGSGITLPNSSIARSLITNTDILILDEATNGLDEKNEQNIFKLLLKLKDKKTLIISTHNQNLLNICDYVFDVEKGKIVKKNKGI